MTLPLPEKPVILTRKLRRLAPLLRDKHAARAAKLAADRLEKARASFGDLRPVVSLQAFRDALTIYNRFARVPATDADASVE